MSSSEDFEKYAKDWLSPVSIERLFADVLTKDKRFEEFRPEEINIKKKRKVRKLAGALSAYYAGIGWKKVFVPTTMVKFNSCPISLGVFANRKDMAQVIFCAPVPSNIRGREFKARIATVRMEDPEKARIEYNSGNRYTKIIQELKNDVGLSEKLINIYRKGLIFRLPSLQKDICTIMYEGVDNLFFASSIFILDHRKKKWMDSIQQFNIKPEDFVENIFSAAWSICKHIQKFRISL